MPADAWRAVRSFLHQQAHQRSASTEMRQPAALADSIDMTAALSAPRAAHGGSHAEAAVHADPFPLRRLVIDAGLCWAILFVVAGLGYRLQLFGDGSIFSYAVAVEQAWSFHWHNIPGRLFVYLFCYVPAEAYVHLAKDPQGGIAVYGMLFFGAQLIGLAATWAADRSKSRIIFAYACGSTACLCPFVFGFPTEMWMAHAVFWPTLALCHCASRGIGGSALVFLALLALAFTHEGALVLAVAILVTLALRGLRDPALLRATACFCGVVLIWAAVKAALPPDDYIVDVMHRAAFNFIDVRNLAASDLFVLMAAAVAGYAIAVPILRLLALARPHAYAGSIVLAALTAYWLGFDHALHADNRYYLRTVLLMAIPVLGGLAAAYALRADGRLKLAVPLLPRLLTALAGRSMLQATAGAVALMMLVHAVETAKFVGAWTDYEAAVRSLATGTASDPVLGDPIFVSSDRIDAERNRLSWSSTVHFLSVLLAPGFAPARLVVDPRQGYFWLSCETAMNNETAYRAIPVESRRLVRVHACLHRFTRGVCRKSAVCSPPATANP
jgi:hypothetical protein